MATTFQKDIQPSNSTDALFRAWCVFLRDAILTGLVQTADTGQMDFTTVVAPVAANTKKGYIIVRMNDSLQATKPVYVRIDFGSGSAANLPGVWLTIGTGSDGAGTISGAVFSPGVAPDVSGSSNGTGRTNSSHSSASTSHCAVALFVESTAVFCMTFSIERGRTSAGAEDGDFVFLQYGPGSTGGSLTQFRYLVRAGGTQVGQSAAPIVTCPARPMHTQQDVGYGNIIPFKPSGSFAIPAPPCLGYIVTEGDSWTTDAVITVYKYGVPVTYRRMNVERIHAPAGVQTANHVVWQRYE